MRTALKAGPAARPSGAVVDLLAGIANAAEHHHNATPRPPKMARQADALEIEALALARGSVAGDG